VDRRTLLVDDAEPAGSSADVIADDGAFLVDLVDGTLTRLDPGVAGASTSSASPDGSRSVFALVPGSQTWLRVDGTNQAVSEGYGALASLDHRVLVTDGDGRVTLRCVA
jgi:Tol biopolymer transport system component